ncbi:T9SS type A sorting domain-containing protein, partial [Chryseosolibacter indicus]
MLAPYDTLIGFEIYFPPYGISSNQSISFNIFHDDNGKPGEVWQTISSRVINQPSLNTFQLVRFTPALLINESKFYIGWRQPTTGRALVGLDVNNDSGNKIFVNTNGFWYQNVSFTGSLMIRPVFGKGTIRENTVGVEEQLKIAIYPNPNPGGFYIEGFYDKLEIINLAGVPVSFQSETHNDKTFVQLNRAPGLYLLKLTRATVTKTYKIVIAQ